MTMKRKRANHFRLAGLAIALGLLPGAGAARSLHASVASEGESRIFLPLGLRGTALEGSPGLPLPPPSATARATDLPTAAPSETALPAPTDPPTTVPLPQPSPTAAPAAGDCPTNNFVEVKADPHNSAYPDPTLKVSCSAGVMVVESNGIPSFEFRQITPNQLKAQTFKWQIPLQVKMSETETQVPLLGPVGIVVDGLPIYGPNEAPAQGTADPFLDGILDFCGGHTGPVGDYHRHARPECLFKQAPKDLVGKVVGYGFDGIEILSPYICEDVDCESVRKLTSSWQKTSEARNAWDSHGYVAGSGDLDRCNGKVDPAGVYHYYATDSFPYLMACYKGVATQNGGGGGGGGGMPPGPRPTRRP